MTEDERIPLVSATGSIRMGKEVAKTVGGRLGKTILELGGNNAIIISENADIEMSVRATVFGAVGTAGQRCTSTRRLIIHESVYNQVKERLINIYENISIGDPLEPGILVGPLIDQLAVDAMQHALQETLAFQIILHVQLHYFCERCIIFVGPIKKKRCRCGSYNLVPC